MLVLSIILTLLVAALGSFVFVKLKVPAGAFLGAMIFVAIYNVLVNAAFIPQEASPFIRIFAGAMIGSRMKRSDVIEMKIIVVPAILLVFGMLILNLSLGYGINILTGLELPTALLGSAPGGIQDMALIAEDLHAEAAQVALLQTVRVLGIMGINPIFLSIYLKRRRRLYPDSGILPERGAKSVTSGGKPASQAKRSFNEKIRLTFLPFARTIAFAAVGGFLLYMTPMPAGAMVGAMLATVISTLFVRPAHMPNRVRSIVMTCAGAFIGKGIGADDLIRLGNIIVPAVILVLVLLVANFIFGLLIHKITKLDLTTSLYASAAGGLTDMALIADAMGADSPKVAVLQLLRLIGVVTLFPTIIKLLTSLA